MPAPPSVAQLRARAATLRQLAHQIERSPVMQLDALAGDDTWRFPRAQECRALLAADLHELHQVVDDLRSIAWRLEVQADEAAAAAWSAPAAARW